MTCRTPLCLGSSLPVYDFGTCVCEQLCCKEGTSVCRWFGRAVFSTQYSKQILWLFAGIAATLIIKITNKSGVFVEVMNTADLLINLLMYLFLPLWGLAGFADWCCHRATKIEATSGIKESLMHCAMGIQIAIPILLCLLFQVNVLVLLICFAAFFLHEWVAHMDVQYALPRREISIWEMHAHSFLATLPLYMLSLIVVVTWPVGLKVLSFDWQGQLSLVRIEEAHGSESYLPGYLLFMCVFCVFPYLEEFIRCLIAEINKARHDKAL